jgi:hypothetical protein
MEEYMDYEVIEALTQKKKGNKVAEAIAVTTVAATAAVAAGIVIKKWGLAKLIGGMAVPFMVKDTMEAFDRSKKRTMEYMQEHKNGRHYIKLS